jgi:hypothetical protein
MPINWKTLFSSQHDLMLTTILKPKNYNKTNEKPKKNAVEADKLSVIADVVPFVHLCAEKSKNYR